MNIPQIVNDIENNPDDTFLTRAMDLFTSSTLSEKHKWIYNPTYTFLGSPEEDTILSRNVGLALPNTSSNEFTVHICMYRRHRMNIPVVSSKMNMLPIEYVSFFMEKNDYQYTFPSFLYKYRETETDDDINNNLLKTACIEKILDVRSLVQKTRTTEKLPVEIDLGYKGFYMKGTTAFVFFDSNKIETMFEHVSESKSTIYSVSPNHIWAIADEIVNKQSVLGILIDTHIVQLFQKTPILWNIQFRGYNIVYPRQFYALIASNIEDIHEMNYITETYPKEGKTLLHMSMALPYAYDDIFSERYLFTKYPLPERTNPTRLYKRYACFLYNPRYILDETYAGHVDCIKKYPNNTIENIKMEIEHENLAERNRLIPCIGFIDKLKHHHRLELWGVIRPDYFAEIDPSEQS
jgi:hypothetical protein